MTDTRLEREIEALLAIDPAPDFRARMRDRLAQEPLRAAAAWRFSPSFAPAVALRLAAAAALVAAVALGAFLVRVNEPSPQPTELVTRSVLPGGYAALPTVVAAAGLTQRISRREPMRPPRRRMQAELEVIVDPLEAAAWRRLLADMSAGRMALPLVADATRPTPVPEGFIVPPVIIEPLAPDFREQGVHP